jgi:hypothetical protein
MYMRKKKIIIKKEKLFKKLVEHMMIYQNHLSQFSKLCDLQNLKYEQKKTIRISDFV